MRTAAHILPTLRTALVALPPRPWPVVIEPDHRTVGPVKLSSGAAEDFMVSIGASIEDLMFDAEASEKWKAIALQFTQLVLVRISREELKCNVCQMVNAHMPSRNAAPLIEACVRLSNREKAR